MISWRLTENHDNPMESGRGRVRLLIQPFVGSSISSEIAETIMRGGFWAKASVVPSCVVVMTRDAPILMEAIEIADKQGIPLRKARALMKPGWPAWFDRSAAAKRAAATRRGHPRRSA